jgi:hypothetical protein
MRLPRSSSLPDPTKVANVFAVLMILGMIITVLYPIDYRLIAKDLSSGTLVTEQSPGVAPHSN